MVDNEVNRRVVIEIVTDDKASKELEKIQKLIDGLKGGTINVGVGGAAGAGGGTTTSRRTGKSDEQKAAERKIREDEAWAKKVRRMEVSEKARAMRQELIEEQKAIKLKQKLEIDSILKNIRSFDREQRNQSREKDKQSKLEFESLKRTLFNPLPKLMKDMTFDIDQKINELHEHNKARTAKEMSVSKEMRRVMTGLLIDFHVLRILAQNSKVLNAMVETLSQTLGALVDVALVPLMEYFVPFIQNLLGLVSWVSQLNGAIRGLIAGLFAFGIALTVTTGTVGAVLSVHKWAKEGISNIRGRASGGPLGAGQMAIVGERGPELIVPSHAVDVVPNSRLRFLAEGTSAGSILGGALAGGLLGGVIGGLPGAAIGGIGGAVAGGLVDLPSLLGDAVGGVMSNTGVQAVLTTLNVVASSINSVLAPLAPVMGVAGAAIGAAYGAKRALGGTSEKLTQAQIKQDAMIGYGTQNIINTGAKGTNNILTLILLRLSQCFRICPDSISKIGEAIKPATAAAAGAGAISIAVGVATANKIAEKTGLEEIGTQAETIANMLKTPLKIPQVGGQPIADTTKSGMYISEATPTPEKTLTLEPSIMDTITNTVGQLAPSFIATLGAGALFKYGGGIFGKAKEAILGKPIEAIIGGARGGAGVLGKDYGYVQAASKALTAPMNPIFGYTGRLPQAGQMATGITKDITAEQIAAAKGIFSGAGSGARAAGIGTLIGAVVLQGIEDYKNVMRYQKGEALGGKGEGEPWELLSMLKGWSAITNETEFNKRMQQDREQLIMARGGEKVTEPMYTFHNTFNIQGTDSQIVDRIVKELQLQSNRTRGMGV